MNIIKYTKHILCSNNNHIYNHYQIKPSFHSAHRSGKLPHLVIENCHAGWKCGTNHIKCNLSSMGKSQLFWLLPITIYVLKYRKKKKTISSGIWLFRLSKWPKGIGQAIYRPKQLQGNKSLVDIEILEGYQMGGQIFFYGCTNMKGWYD